MLASLLTRLLRLNQYRSLTRKAEEKSFLKNEKKDPDRTSTRQMGLRSTLFWVRRDSSNSSHVHTQSCEECYEEFCHGGCMKFEYEKHKVNLV